MIIFPYQSRTDFITGADRKLLLTSDRTAQSAHLLSPSRAGKHKDSQGMVDRGYGRDWRIDIQAKSEVCVTPASETTALLEQVLIIAAIDAPNTQIRV